MVFSEITPNPGERHPLVSMQMDSNEVPNWGSVLMYIIRDVPITYYQIIELWERYRDFIIIETVVDIAAQQHISLAAAAATWEAWWKEYNRPDGV